MNCPTPETWTGDPADLRALHDRTGLTQGEAARRLGWKDARAFRFYLNGTRPASLVLALAVWALGVEA